ncbi:hypothetical protein GGR52DRAFT_557198 [Hypoxylon sp. FL1284]|nr:hypothetical protein GGR52DRAFT_557198 [Hypoxylon sp. FL1284]
MPENLDPSEQSELRLLSRSPHPYHHQNSDLLDPSDHLAYKSPANPRSTRPVRHSTSREITPSSDSGTEADDEHFLKGLPAPRRWRKGLRGRNEVLSGTSTPIPSPALLEEEGGRPYYNLKREPHLTAKKPRDPAEALRRRRELVRRFTELLIIGSLGTAVRTNPHVQPIWLRWNRELYAGMAVSASLVLLYPLRLVMWAYRHRTPSRRLPICVPSSFDPAPLIYPPAIALLVSLLLSVDNEAVLVPNIVLAVGSLPPSLIPAISDVDQICDPLHWVLSCTPLVLAARKLASDGAGPASATVSLEAASLLYPLHQNLCSILRTLTTTSLLTAELQLLSIALINLLLLSSSPQAVILKIMLWVGGLDILISCTQTIQWGVSLARVPKWRFKRMSTPSKLRPTLFSTIMSWRRVRHDLFHAPVDSLSCSSCEAFDDHEDSDDLGSVAPKGPFRVKTMPDGGDSAGVDGNHGAPPSTGHKITSSNVDPELVPSPPRRHSLPSTENVVRKSHTHTPSGRRKRAASNSVRAFFSLTQEQAAIRKWVYAVYVYICIASAVLLPIPFAGVRVAVRDAALHGNEPVGWALGYLFGNLSWFRWEVISRSLERWICLPPRSLDEAQLSHEMGWVELFRQSYLGEANTRLALSAYFLAIIVLGLIVVFRLSPVYEVDTRRKVFHFMMVTMLLPATYVDPTFVALALSIMLALFLLLDLLRASQLPPLSKPLASFLAPYVDGRDLRGPVVISHIFLLIGCAIPLWLSLGSLPRAGAGYLEGWAVPTREASMVSGVVCVGLGDAAASLIGRRYGRQKWFWGGGKSLEGSVAFAAAVFFGLMAARLWLRVGGWPATDGNSDAWTVSARKMGVCAATASLTEAVLTGGNDNVVVPVVLWTCAKSLGI